MYKRGPSGICAETSSQSNFGLDRLQTRAIVCHHCFETLVPCSRIL
jgi:hypothetical protein